MLGKEIYTTVSETRVFMKRSTYTKCINTTTMFYVKVVLGL